MLEIVEGEADRSTSSPILVRRRGDGQRGCA